MKDFITRSMLFAALSAVGGSTSLYAQSSEFFEYGGLEYHITGVNEVAVLGYTVEPVELVIPAAVQYDGYNFVVTGIEDEAFRDCVNLVSVTFPETLTSIEHIAFSGCSNLVSIDLPENLTSMGSSVFYGCSSLTSVTCPESLTSIGDAAFYGCSSLTFIDLPDNLTTVSIR